MGGGCNHIIHLHAPAAIAISAAAAIAAATAAEKSEGRVVRRTFNEFHK